MDKETINARIEKNRDEINNILHKEDWPLELIYIRINILSAQNESLIKRLNS